MIAFNPITRRISFRVALIIYAVAPLVAALGIAGYLALNSFENAVEKQMQKDLELVARAIQLPLSDALEKDRMGSMMQALESVFSIDRVYSAYVYDKEGNEIAKLGLTDPEPERKRLTELAEEGERRGEYGKIAGREVYSYYVPLTDTGGQINGLLHLTRRGRDFRDHIKTIRVKGALGLVALLLILSGLVLYGHHRALGTHLNRLASSMSRVARGDRTHRFDYEGPKEVVALGATFNNMLNSIEEAEQKLAEQRRTQDKLERELRRSEKLAALGRLAAGTAHELGTPLSVINGKAQRALRRQDMPDQARKTLEDIRREVARMEYIIKQLLNFTRGGSKSRIPTAPARLASSAVEALREEAVANHAAIELAGDEGAPMITVDPVRLEQALINLLKNAIQCSENGRVRLSWGQEGEAVVFRVEDDGPGIPPEIRSKIFEPFFTTKQVGEGTGLGLSVAYTVAEEHEGGIEISESSLGGASFSLDIPIK
ncbi:MAG: ATP-binding protein [Desulfobacteraceae bacterium]